VGVPAPSRRRAARRVRQDADPLLIFDQFEEIFTLAQSDDVGGSAPRSSRRPRRPGREPPPKALEARIEHDDARLEQFDFARADYRILIALREDYLAHLEGVKASCRRSRRTGCGSRG
jgi:hypothetical protein